jgi:hypothetical protein
MDEDFKMLKKLVDEEKTGDTSSDNEINKSNIKTI